MQLYKTFVLNFLHALQPHSSVNNLVYFENIVEES
jgi:hypothetical protein